MNFLVGTRRFFLAEIFVLFGIGHLIAIIRTWVLGVVEYIPPHDNIIYIGIYANLYIIKHGLSVRGALL